MAGDLGWLILSEYYAIRVSWQLVNRSAYVTRSHTLTHGNTHTHHKFCIQSNFSDLRQPKTLTFWNLFKSTDVSALFLLLKVRRKQQSHITAKHTSGYIVFILYAFLQYFPKILSSKSLKSSITNIQSSKPCIFTIFTYCTTHTHKTINYECHTIPYNHNITLTLCI